MTTSIQPLHTAGPARAGAVLLMAAVLAGPAFAQAGSTGGTLGKTDQSLSGGSSKDTPSEKPQRGTPSKQGAAVKQDAAKASRCSMIVGTWMWVHGVDFVFNPNGTYQPASGTGGKWTCANGVYVIRAHGSNGVDRMTISSDGSTMTGTSAVTGHTITFSVVRKK